MPLATNLSLDPRRVHVLEVSSPQEARWKPFMKSDFARYVHMRYMPMVSLAEMHSLRKILQPSSTDAGMIARYKVLGGTVRGALILTTDAKELVENALRNTPSLDAIKSVTMGGELDSSGIATIPSTLVHFRVWEETEEDELDPTASSHVPTKPFTHYEPIFASNYVRKQIRTRFQRDFVQDLQALVDISELPSVNSLTGSLYESRAHEVMEGSEQRSSKIRSLQGKGDLSALNLYGMLCHEFDDLSELQPGYNRPLSKSLGAVDFVIQSDKPQRCFVGNMTLNLRHGISIKRLLEVVLAMGFKPVRSPPELKFLWLLPNLKLYHAMAKQNFTYGGLVVSDPSNTPSSSRTQLTPGEQLRLRLQRLVNLHQCAVYMPPSVDKPVQAETSQGGELSEMREQDEEMSSERLNEGMMETASTIPASTIPASPSSSAGPRPQRQTGHRRPHTETPADSRRQRREGGRSQSGGVRYSAVYIPLLTEAAIRARILVGNRATRLQQYSRSEELLRKFPEAADLIGELSLEMPRLRHILTHPSETVDLLGEQKMHFWLTTFDNWVSNAGALAGAQDDHLHGEVQDWFIQPIARQLATVRDFMRLVDVMNNAMTAGRQ